MRLLVDAMLGSLARFLRMAGHDARYAGDATDEEILRTAEDEDRVVVTRDAELASRSEDTVLLRSKDLDEQLSAVAEALDLDLSPSTQRCSRCNAPLRDAADADEEYVPDDARDLKRCTECGQYYWKGSHWERIKERLEKHREELEG